jgi:hypothetical protein
LSFIFTLKGLGDELLGPGFHTCRHEGREIESGVPVEHELVTKELEHRVSHHLEIRHGVAGALSASPGADDLSADCALITLFGG